MNYIDKDLVDLTSENDSYSAPDPLPEKEGWEKEGWEQVMQDLVEDEYNSKTVPEAIEIIKRSIEDKFCRLTDSQLYTLHRKRGFDN